MTHHSTLAAALAAAMLAAPVQAVETAEAPPPLTPIFPGPPNPYGPIVPTTPYPAPPATPTVDYPGVNPGGITATPIGGGVITGPAAAGGWILVGVEAGVLIYKSGEYLYYIRQTVDDVGSEPAHNLTDYENPANYWDQFWYYWTGSSNG